jgi:3-deoxy-D-manno-octulosonic-acid transferase
MNTVLYHFFLITASAIARCLTPVNDKIDRFFKLRRGEIEHIEYFFKEGEPREVLWFHASSAGEFEQAKPLIEYCKERYPDSRLIASFFSPSGYDAGMKYDTVDFCFNIPLDYRKSMSRLMDTITPRALLFSRYDVWPNLTRAAHKRGIPLILFSASLREHSYRHRFPLRLLLRKTYTRLTRIYAISQSDAARFMKIVKDGQERIIISGDTRFDRIRGVIHRGSHTGPLLQKSRENLTFIAGSTYRVTERLLLRIAVRLNSSSSIRWIIVPHEVDKKNIKRLEQDILKRGFSPVRYSTLTQPVSLSSKEILIVDTIGILAFLYAEADIVFVGGSFRGSVHSVLEPAIWGKPILTGPAIANAHEAIALKEHGGLIACRNSSDLQATIMQLIADNRYRQSVSLRAKEYFNSNTGAATNIIRDLENILNR